MDVAGLSHERGGRPVVGQKPSGARDRRGRRTHGGAARPGPAFVRQNEPELHSNRPAGDVDRGATAPDTADQRQAEYFLRLLCQNRRLIDHRIDGYHRAIAIAEANGDTEGACGLRRTARIEEQDRKTLDGLIENLQRRFPLRAGSEVSSPRKARLVVR
jgi:hypothetical protein